MSSKPGFLDASGIRGDKFKEQMGDFHLYRKSFAGVDQGCGTT